MDDEITDNLNPFAARFARSLFQRYPEWEQYIVPASLKWQAIDDLAVEVPSRFVPHCPLRIETMHGSIIVQWGKWHVHCDPNPIAATRRRQISKALRAIRWILDEDLVIIEHWQDGRFMGDRDCKPAKLKRCLKVASSGLGQVTARSWRGTYDSGTIDPKKL